MGGGCGVIVWSGQDGCVGLGFVESGGSSISRDRLSNSSRSESLMSLLPVSDSVVAGVALVLLVSVSVVIVSVGVMLAVGEMVVGVAGVVLFWVLSVLLLAVGVVMVASFVLFVVAAVSCGPVSLSPFSSVSSSLSLLSSIVPVVFWMSCFPSISVFCFPVSLSFRLFSVVKEVSLVVLLFLGCCFCWCLCCDFCCSSCCCCCGW